MASCPPHSGCVFSLLLCVCRPSLPKGENFRPDRDCYGKGGARKAPDTAIIVVFVYPGASGPMNIQQYFQQVGTQARAAARHLARATRGDKDRALAHIADALRQ